ncbi:MAG: MFS transporter, partial [Bacteroidota bacterium]
MQNTPFYTFYSKTALLASASLFFDRMAYYGLRAILILYLLEKLEWDQNSVFEFYGGLFIASSFFGLIGSLIGDLTKNKILCIIAFIALIISSLLIAIPKDICVLAGITLLVIFEKISAINIKSIFAREHLNEDASLEGGFTFLYLIINLGAIIGAAFIAWVSKELSFSLGFVICAFLYGFGLTVAFFIEAKDPNAIDRSHISATRKWLIPILIGFALCLFWAVYELNFNSIYLYVRDIFQESEDQNLSMTISLLQTLPTLFFGVILYVLWALF